MTATVSLTNHYSLCESRAAGAGCEHDEPPWMTRAFPGLGDFQHDSIPLVLMPAHRHAPPYTRGPTHVARQQA